MPYNTQPILRDVDTKPIPQFWDETAGVYKPLPGSDTGLKVQLPTGAADAATLATRLSETDFDAKAGALAETAPASDTASSGLNGRLQRIAQRLTSLIALLPASLGLKADAASLSVGLSTEQRAILAAVSTETTLVAASAKLPASLGLKADAASLSVGLSTEQRAILATHLTESDFDSKVGGLTETAPATDTASSGTNGRLQRIAQRVSALITLYPTSLGQKVKASSFAVTLASDQELTLPAGAATETTLGTRLTEADFDSKIGGLTETAPATDTASSGLNGRLQRVAQRLTSLIALLPASIGQKNMAGSLSVSLASDNIPHVIVDSGVVSGGGTQYATGTVAATPTGTQANWDEGGTQRAVSLVKPMPIQAASLPLPTNAATEATLLAASAKLPASLGIKADAASLSVGLSTEQRSFLVALLTQTDFDSLTGSIIETAPANDTASSGLNGRLQRIAQRLTSLIALLPSSIGLKADAASLSVGLSTEQRAILVAQATEATLVAQSAKLPASLGLKADAASLSVGLSTEQRAFLAATLTEATYTSRTGSLTETAPATDTASSGLNGRLQRVAQRLTLLIGSLPSTVGQKVLTDSLSVALASDQPSVPTYRTTGVATGGGWGNHNRLISTGTNAVSIKGTQGQVGGVQFHSNIAGFLRLYNKATAPTPGTDFPVWGPFKIAADKQGAITFGSEGLDLFPLGIGLDFTAARGSDGRDATAIAGSPDGVVSINFY